LNVLSVGTNSRWRLVFEPGQLDSESDFGERYAAHIEQVERSAADEFQHLALGLGTAQLRMDIRVEKPTRH
jgi:hypothetical protein